MGLGGPISQLDGVACGSSTMTKRTTGNITVTEETALKRLTQCTDKKGTTARAREMTRRMKRMVDAEENNPGMAWGNVR